MLGEGKKETTRARQPHRRYRIAMVCDFFHPRLGGVENHIWSLSHHLLQLGHSVIVITHAYNAEAERECYSGVHYYESMETEQPLKVYYCPFYPMVDQDSLPTFTATMPLIRWILVREQIDIVHSHQATSTMSNESIIYAGMLGLRTVYTDHSLFEFDDVPDVILNRVSQTTLSRADALIAVSHACCSNLVLRSHLDLERQHISVIPNAIDPAKFFPEPSKRPSDRIQIVVVSRLVFRKGVDLLVGVIPEICHSLPEVDFLIGGDGAKLLDLQEMVERERLEDRVSILGATPHSQVRDVLVQGHLFLNCSLTESFCIAILEAASTGLLVVSTNVGGVPEVLPPDMIHVCDPNVPDIVQELKAAVAQQKNFPIEPWSMHERVQSMFSWERVARETVQVYDTIINPEGKDIASSHGTSVAGWALSLEKGIARLVVDFLSIILTMFLRFLEYVQPKDQIDVVPDVWSECKRRKAKV